MQKLYERKASSFLVFIWLVMFALAQNTDLDLLLCGKGSNIIGLEKWRFYTAGFIHTNPIHVLGNVYLMYWLGSKYEKELGSFRFFTTGFFGSTVAYIVYGLIYPNATNCVGGSGFWYALAGELLIRQLRNKDFTKSGQKWLIIYALVFLPIIPIIPGMNYGTVVFHVTAFVFGMIGGFIPDWSKS